ncbi:unnamed protein product, partial [Mesorhabditis belari]|uniref:Uncharacterized protein n=1 Tax=Mesorhabditis belari TaxID=2138241 RepID=A0AAF3J351_9BILA
MRAVSPAPDEVMEIVIPFDYQSRLALSSTQYGMDAQIQTANRPVVLCVAPRHSQDPQLCDDCRRSQHIEKKK